MARCRAATGFLALTILGGIENSVSKNTEVEYERHRNFSCVTTVLTFGKKLSMWANRRYAEGGRHAHPELTAEDLRTIENVKQSAKDRRHHRLRPTARTFFRTSVHGRHHCREGYQAPRVTASQTVLFGDYPFTGTLCRLVFVRPPLVYTEEKFLSASCMDSELRRHHRGIARAKLAFGAVWYTPVFESCGENSWVRQGVQS